MQLLSIAVGYRKAESLFTTLHCFFKLPVALLLSALFLLPLQALSDEENNAETLESHGLALYQKELYDEAVRAFRQLLEIRPNQRVYFNIGQCELMRKRYDLALEALTIYLAGDRDKIAEKRLEYTEQVVEEITPIVGAFDIRGESPLEVWIDDELRGNLPLNTVVYVLEGERRLVFKRDGETVQTETYAANSGETITIHAPEVAPDSKIEPEPTPEETVENESADTEESSRKEVSVPPPEPSDSPLRNIGIVTASLGGGLLVAVIVTGSLALSKDNQLAERCPDKDQVCPESNEKLADKAVSLGVATNVLIPIGAVAMVTGVALAIVGHRKNAERRESIETSDWRLTPYGVGNEAGILIEGRF